MNSNEAVFTSVNNGTIIKQCPNPQRGRGVFATRDFDVGDIIEVAPVVTFSDSEREHIDKTVFTNYWFSWKLDEDEKEVTISMFYDTLVWCSSRRMWFVPQSFE